MSVKTPHRFSRQELYDLVWSSPLTTLGKRFGISDVGLAKACRKADIPLPGAGHWARRAAGKPFVQPSLPPRGFGKPDAIDIGAPSRWWRPIPDDEEIMREPIPPVPTFEESVEALTERARRLAGKVSVPKLERAHPVIAQVIAEDAERARRVEAEPYYWKKPAQGDASARRRLRILNGLFLALARCGGAPWVRGHETFETGVRLGEEDLTLKLEPLQSPSRRKKGEGKAQARGELQLTISCWEDGAEIPVRWQDTDEATLEKQMTDIVVGVLVAGEMHYRVGIRRQHDWRIERKHDLEEEARKAAREAAERERQRILRIQERRHEALVVQVRAWSRAAEIRRFVEAVVTASEALPVGSEARAERDAWVEWALTEAMRIDPLEGGDVRKVWAHLDLAAKP